MCSLNSASQTKAEKKKNMFFKLPFLHNHEKFTYPNSIKLTQDRC